jgi:hypothetical protein
MRIMLHAILCACLLSCIGKLQAQTDSLRNQLSPSDIDSKTIAGLQKQYSALGSKLDKQSTRLLNSMQRKENKLHDKLISSTDSLKAKAVFTNDVKQHYTDLQSGISKETDKFKQFPLKEYIPGLDSMQTSLNFLLKNPNLPTDKLEALQSLSVKLEGL